MQPLTSQDLIQHGLDSDSAVKMADRINALIGSRPEDELWRFISQQLLTPEHPFELHRFLFDLVYAENDPSAHPPPAWMPTEESIASTNLGRLMADLGLESVWGLHTWSVQHRAEFWRHMTQRLGICFQQPPEKLVDLTDGIESPRWLSGAKLNIVDSCFRAEPEAVAIVLGRQGDELSTVCYGELEALTNRVANGLLEAGFSPGEGIAIAMPMTVEAVAAYLGIIRAGLVAVSIADSLASEEIAVRFRIADAKGVFTQDFVSRAGKRIPLYERVISAGAPRAVVLQDDPNRTVPLREGDLSWKTFLSDDNRFEPAECEPDDYTNLLFSSGTTAEPKAIPWTHTTPIKCAADAYLYHDVQPGERLAWPTNLGWMMGPWLVYASLMNRGTMALYYDAPTLRDFGRFVQDAEVTTLGVVPSLVKSWRSGCMHGLDWSRLKAFSSTGECSNPDDMLYLMSLAGYKPVIEYCGGTEIGGAYLTSTLLQPNVPSLFSTPAFGLNLVILDEHSKAADEGEVFLEPPSIGLSTELLNQEHHQAYYQTVPKGPHGEVLRRHGDAIERLANGYYRAQGRVDDTMNLGGIKASSAQIERVLNRVTGVDESAAIAVPPPGGGPSLLVIYAVRSRETDLDQQTLHCAMQATLKVRLNPFFKIHDLVTVRALPRTASNKVMRRLLREQYRRERS